MANYTDITVLLDRSGSMERIKVAMENGFDEFVNENKAVPTTRISLVQFDGTNPFETLYTARPITDVPRLRLEPRGMTPLYDAACRAIDEAGRRFAAMKEADRPDKVLFVIITDGQENASREFKQVDVKQRIERQTNAYNWQFVYLGADQNALTTARDIGIDWNKAISYDATPTYTAASMRSLARNTLNYAISGASASLDYTVADRTATKAVVTKDDLTVEDNS